MISNKEPIKLQFASAWRTYKGGSLIRKMHGKENVIDDNFPEEWIMSLVSARNPGREAIKNEGLTYLFDSEISLKHLIETDPEYYLGKKFVAVHGQTTGVLIKLIDSSERLSVQVHPDKTTAKKLFNSEFGKTECWHILGGRSINGEAPCIYFGFKEGVTRQIWKQYFDEQDIQGMLDCMHKIPVKKGETYLIKGGVPHAIGAGCFLTEIQEPTDYTIRVERVTVSGQKIDDRQCHQGLGFDKMFDCFHYNGMSKQEVVDAWSIKKTVIEKTDCALYESYINNKDTDMFSLYNISLSNGEYELKLPEYFSGIYVLNGCGELMCGEKTYKINKTDQFFLPAGCKQVTFKTDNDLEILHFFGPAVE